MKGKGLSLCVFLALTTGCIGNTIASTTRLNNPPHLQPAAITVFTAQDIEAIGARKLTDVFRYINGIVVASVSSNERSVTYHGGNLALAQRIQVLVDGHKIFQGGLARIEWDYYPINVDDITRIEFLRSSATASHGSNAMMGVISITTKKAMHRRNKAIVSVGTDGYADAMLQYNNDADDWHWAASTHYKQYKEFKYIEEPDNRRRKFNEVTGLNFRADHKSGWSTQMGLTDNNLRYGSSSITGGNSFPTRYTSERFLSIDYTDKNIQWHNYYATWKQDLKYDACLPKTFFSEELRELFLTEPQLALLNLRQPDMSEGLYCGSSYKNAVASQFDSDYQQLWTVGNLRLAAGAGLRLGTANSSTYFNGDEKYEKSGLVFVNSDYTWNKDFLFSFASLTEWNELTDYTAYTSPRLGVNWLANNKQTFRAGLIKSVRHPGMFAQEADWRFKIDGDEGVLEAFVFAQGNSNLLPERVISKEIGWNYRSGGATIDVRLFDEKLYSLISDSLFLLRFEPTNNNSMNNKGTEIEFTYRWGKFNFRSGYSYMDSEATHDNETHLSPRHTGFVNLRYKKDNIKYGLSWFYADQIGGYPAVFGNVDADGYDYHEMRGTLALELNPTWKLNLKLGHRFDENPDTVPINLQTSKTSATISVEYNP